MRYLPRGEVPGFEGLSVHVGRVDPREGRWGYDDRVARAAEIDRVSIISRHTGGECRGYWLADGRLFLCQPSYSGEWRDLDRAVEAQLGVRLVRYRVGPGGGVEYLPDSDDRVEQMGLFA